jgi:urocanate hydratase
MKIHLGEIFEDLPKPPEFVDGIRRAPARHFNLSQKDTELALKNALRYIPEKWHPVLAPEFMEELLSRGRIYGYRFRPQRRILSTANPSMNIKATASKAGRFRS